MKYIDYREKLGIGFENNEKYTVLLNKVVNYIRANLNDSIYDYFGFYKYMSTVGEPLETNYTHGLVSSLIKTNSMPELIAKACVFSNTFSKSKTSDSDITKRKIIIALQSFLEEVKIPYDIIKDEDGYFIFPKGAKELDDALVSEPLEWLRDYPESRKAWVIALKAYSESTDDTASETADKFRKALERFFQEFFSSEQSLENLKSTYGDYMKSHGVPAEISNNFTAIQQAYTNYINNFAKHHDKTSDTVLEYIMYQTGNLIRLLITLKNAEEKNNAD